MKEVIICHVNGRIIGFATSTKQKYEIAEAFFDDNRQKKGPAGLSVEFTYVKPNILFPELRGAVSGVKKPLLF